MIDNFEQTIKDQQSRINKLEDELRQLRTDLYHADSNLGLMTDQVAEFERLVSSDTVYTLLRFGVKSPSISGVDEYKDDCYHDLYIKSVELRTKLQ